MIILVVELTLDLLDLQDLQDLLDALALKVLEDHLVMLDLLEL
jgi:hypothetical protein